MASTFSFWEQNGAAGGTPVSGTATPNRTECNWKNVDDSTTAYSSSPITAGGNSFVKIQYGGISGTFNQVSNGKWGHTAGSFGAGITLVGKTGTGYVQPATGALSDTVNITAPSGLESAYQTVNFGAIPNAATTGTVTANPCYTSYLFTQLQTTTGASPGDTTQVTLTLSYDES